MSYHLPIRDLEPLCLDAVSKIYLDQKNPPANNYHELYHLPEGMLWLGLLVYREEQGLDKEHIDHGPLSCYFNWFSVSLVNYVRLIALFDWLGKNNLKDSDLIRKDVKEATRKHITAYMHEVIPDILRWRNKVSAHFAITDPRDEDTIWALRSGISLHIAYNQGYYYAGGIQWGSLDLPSWSMTKEIERLRPRYWPYFDFKNFKIGRAKQG